MRSSIPETYTLIGAGRLSTALAVALDEKGLRPELVASRSYGAAAKLASQFSGATARSIDELDTLPGSLTLIAVSDDALVHVSEQIRALRKDWTGHTFIHTSGTWSSDALKLLGEAGASIGSFHPLQTFVALDSAPAHPSLFNAIPISIEGDEDAVLTGRRIAVLLGGDPFQISRDAKMLMHIAAVTASNYLVTLSAIAEEMGALALKEEAPADRYFRALSLRAVENVNLRGPEKALTGPIVRGDVQVLSAHLDRLSKNMPHLLPVYTVLATETVRLAHGSGSISHEVAEEILDLLESSVVAQK